MKPVFQDHQPSSNFSGWEELGPRASGWRIEREERLAEVQAPFFPDQNGLVYEQLLANFPVMMHAMDGSGRISAVNHLWAQTLGFHPSEVVGRSFNELLTPQSRSRLITEIYPKYLQNGTCRDEEMFLQRKDGSLATVQMSMNAYRGDKGRIERSICLLLDVTNRKLAEIAAIRADHRYRGAFQAAPVGMALIAPTGQIDMCNAAFGALLGLTSAEAARLALDETVFHEDRGRLVHAVRAVMTGTGEPAPMLIRLVGKSGKEIEVEASLAPLLNDRQEVELLILQAMSVVQASGHVSAADHKMESIGHLAAGLAHEFNNLLTVIHGNMQLLEDKITGDERSSRRFRETLEASRQASGLTQKLIDIARSKPGRVCPVDVNLALGDLVGLLSRSLGDQTRLILGTHADLPTTLVDPSLFDTAIVQLVVSAVKAGASLVSIGANLVDLAGEKALKRQLEPGPHLLLSFSTETMDWLPETSFVEDMARSAGGRAIIHKEAGQGSSVEILLPATSMAISSPPSFNEPQPLPVAQRRKRILVVEDQAAVRAVACGFLFDFGYDVIEAEDGFQALARLQEDEHIDLMFTDVVMPGGMNGFDLAQAASSMRPDLKIVHTSGYPKGAMVHQDEPRFRQGYIIMKPYRREELERIIAKAFEAQ